MQPSEQLPIEWLAGANPNPPTRQPSHWQQGLASGVAPRRGAPKVPTLDAPPNHGLAPLETLIPELTSLRGRINSGMLYLFRNLDHEQRSESGRQRLLRLVTSEYLPLIEQARAHPADELMTRRDALAERLDRGWATSGSRSDALFVKLLVEYEALCDVLLPDCLSPLLARLETARV